MPPVSRIIYMKAAGVLFLNIRKGREISVFPLAG
jgi:hypothetical protein